MDYLVSLDRKHLVGNPRAGDLPFAVGIPGEFLDWYRQQIAEDVDCRPATHGRVT